MRRKSWSVGGDLEVRKIRRKLLKCPMWLDFGFGVLFVACLLSKFSMLYLPISGCCGFGVRERNYIHYTCLPALQRLRLSACSAVVCTTSGDTLLYTSHYPPLFPLPLCVTTGNQNALPSNISTTVSSQQPMTPLALICIFYALNPAYSTPINSTDEQYCIDFANTSIKPNEEFIPDRNQLCRQCVCDLGNNSDCREASCDSCPNDINKYRLFGSGNLLPEGEAISKIVWRGKELLDTIKANPCCQKTCGLILEFSQSGEISGTQFMPREDWTLDGFRDPRNQAIWNHSSGNRNQFRSISGGHHGTFMQQTPVLASAIGLSLFLLGGIYVASKCSRTTSSTQQVLENEAFRLALELNREDLRPPIRGRLVKLMRKFLNLGCRHFQPRRSTQPRLPNRYKRKQRTGRCQ